ncbi:MAG: ribosome recycling factor [Patescibacteria group bacterium]|nr:ribosome recycling factor [Patescibacteria group bacterium]
MVEIKEAENKINGFINALKQQFMAMRSNRPSPRMVEDIPVEVYGQKMTIKQIGAISIVPPIQIQISVWDKSIVNTAAKAIESSNLNVNANIDGVVIRINLPPLSDERRRELIKIVKREVEDTKIKIRSFRDEINKEIVRDFEEGNITEDAKFKLKEQAQKVVDEANKELEIILKNKTEEIEK